MVAVAACPTSANGSGVSSGVSLTDVRDWLDMIPTKSGEFWYVVCEEWFSYFVSQVSGLTDNQFAPERPKEVVGNLSLKDEKGRIRRDLIMDMDYRIVPQECWDFLVKRFDLTSRRHLHELRVPIIQDGDALGPELYQYEVTLQRENASSSDVGSTEQFSRTTTLAQIEKRMRDLFKIDDDKDTYLRLQPIADCQYMPVEDKSVTLLDSGASESAVLVIGVVGESEPVVQGTVFGPQPLDSHNGLANGSLDMDTSPLSPGPILAQPEASAPSSSLALMPYTGPPQVPAPPPPPPPGPAPGDVAPSGEVFGPHLPPATTPQEPSEPGLCGLPNVGSTCYLGSAIQCLSNARPLAEFFLSDGWKHDLNADNPHGLRGDLAKEFATLLGRMWSGEVSEVPDADVRAFKAVVERKDRNFAQRGEQDAQELLSSVLDGLHEDLLRPKEENEEKTKEEEEDVVEKTEKEEGGVERRSRVAELVHGCQRSTVECAACGAVRVTREPFQLLALPLLLDVTVVHAGDQPVTSAVRVPAGCRVSALLEEAAAALETAADRLWAARIRDFAFSEEMHQEDVVDSPLDVFVYERPPPRLDGVTIEDDRNDAAMENGKDDTPMENGKGDTPMENGKNDTPMENGKGDTPMEDGKDETPMEDGKGDTPMEDGKDETPMEDGKGDTPMEDCKDDTPMEDAKSDTPMEDGKDDTPMDDGKDGTPMEDGQDETMKDGKDAAMDDSKDCNLMVNNKDSPLMDEKDAAVSNGKDDGTVMESGKDVVPLKDGKNDDSPVAALKERRTPVIVIEVASSESDPKPVALPLVFFAQEGQKSVRIADVSAFVRAQLDWRGVAATASFELRTRLGTDLRPCSGPDLQLLVGSPLRLVALCSMPPATTTEASGSEPAPLSLTDCLELFTRREELAGAEAVECERCRRKQRSFRTIDFLQLPPVLIVQLKRATNWSSTGKLKIPVQVPIERLDLSRWTREAPGAPYSLAAVSHHHGLGSARGHYSTLARNWRNGRWYRFNDEKVTEQECKPDPKDAYILVYVREENDEAMEIA